MLRTTLAFAILLAAMALPRADERSVDSYQPSPSAGVADQPKQQEITPTKAQAYEDKRGTEQSPLAVKILETSKTAEDAQRENKERHRKALYDWDTLALSVITLVVAGLTLGAIAVQAYFLWRAVKVSEEAARAAQRSADVVTSQLRAYVLTDSSGVNGFGGTAPVTVQIVMKNTGQTPAINLVGWSGMRIEEYPLKKELPPGAVPPGSNSSLAPGGETSHVIQAPRPLTKNEFDKIVAGTSAIYVFGEITYEDVFKQKHFTRYRLMFGGAAGATRDGSMAICEEGNDAS